MFLKKASIPALTLMLICSYSFAKGDLSSGKAVCQNNIEQKKKDLSKVSGDEVLASVGESDLTMEQVRWLTPTNDLGNLRQIVKSWVETELLYQEAMKQKLEETPSSKFRAQMLVKQAYAAEMIKKEQDTVDMTEEELRAHYDLYKETDPMICTPASYEFSHIRLASKEKALILVERLKIGENFGKIAAHESVYSPDKVKGGRVGPLPESAISRGFGKDFLKALKKAKKGDIFGPVPGKNGLWEIGRFNKKNPIRPMPFEQVVREVKPRLIRARRTGTMLLLKHDLKKKYKDIIFYSPLLMAEDEEPKEENAEPNQPAE